MLGEFWAMSQQSNGIGFSVFAIAILTLFIVALGKRGAWLLLLIVAAMLVRSRIVEGGK